MEKASSTATFEPPAAAPSTAEVVLRVEGLGKKYSRTPAAARRPGLWKLLRTMAGVSDPPCEPTLGREEFWALRDLNFTLRRGECLGLVGLNGAGKSTLLKIILGHVAPDAGQATVAGRAGGLVELGAGFHPEMTGRENITFNAIMLGSTHAEIARQTPDIIAFADLGAFIDSPVKQYSNGMKMRLGFAIAVNFVPDLVVCDEILAVGDFDFRQKCFNRMNELRRDRSFILVSHGARNILNFCDRAILLHRGEMIADGPPERVLREFAQCQRHFSPEHLRSLLATGRASGAAPAALPAGFDDEESTGTAGDAALGSVEEPVLHIPDPALVAAATGAPPVEPGWTRLDGAAFNDRAWDEATLVALFGQHRALQLPLTGLAVEWNLRWDGRQFVHVHGQPWRVRVWLRTTRPLIKFQLGFPIYDDHGARLLGPTWEQPTFPATGETWRSIELTSQPFPLLTGNYYFILSAREGPAFLLRQRLARFTIQDPLERAWRYHGEFSWREQDEEKR